MRVSGILFLAVVAIWIGACGGKSSKETTAPAEADTAAPSEGDGASKEAAVETGKKQIRNWLSEDLSKKIAASGKIHGKTLGDKIVQNGEVLAKAKALGKDVLKEKTVKPKLDKIEDKATAGFGKQLTLGWKALKAGGIDAFKQKVGADANRVGIEVLTDHIKNNLLKDERTSALFKSFSPVLKIQARVAAIGLQENLSPKVTQKILSLALRIAAAGENSEMAMRVQAWLNTCETDANEKIDRLMEEVVALQSVSDALFALAFEVLDHPRTKKELVAMVNTLLDNQQVNDKLIKVYEAAAFEKGDGVIRDAMTAVIGLDVVNQAIFDTLNRLASAPGAGAIIGKRLQTIGEDPKLAAIVEDFILSILDTCGDPSGN